MGFVGFTGFALPLVAVLDVLLVAPIVTEVQTSASTVEISPRLVAGDGVITVTNGSSEVVTMSLDWYDVTTTEDGAPQPAALLEHVDDLVLYPSEQGRLEVQAIDRARALVASGNLSAPLTAFVAPVHGVPVNVSVDDDFVISAERDTVVDVRTRVSSWSGEVASEVIGQLLVIAEVPRTVQMDGAPWTPGPRTAEIVVHNGDGEPVRLRQTTWSVRREVLAGLAGLILLLSGGLWLRLNR